MPTSINPALETEVKILFSTYVSGFFFIPLPGVWFSLSTHCVLIDCYLTLPPLTYMLPHTSSA